MAIKLAAGNARSATQSLDVSLTLCRTHCSRPGDGLHRRIAAFDQARSVGRNAALTFKIASYGDLF